MNRNNITRLSLAIVFICFLLSTFVSLWSLRVMVKQNVQELSKALTAQIYDTISEELSEPVAVARTMANDRFLISILEHEAENDSLNNQTLIGDYLARLHEGLSYESAFVISDARRNYYSYTGLGKTMDVENDSHDAWYPQFLEQNTDYAIDVDRDELHSNEWTLFVNARIEADDGNLLGVCGVGIHMIKSMALFSELESEYNVKISLIDSNGLVHADTDEARIENDYIRDISLHETDEYVYESRQWGNFIVTKYLDRIGWYLVVQSEDHTQMYRFFNVIFLNIILCILVMFILIFAIRIVMERTAALAYASFQDQATSLLNRRAFEEEKARLGSSALNERFVYLTADLNGLKNVNDTLGHAAGDELIKGAAQCLNACFGGYGNVYRIGGDEFAATLTITQAQLAAAIQHLEKMSAAWTGEFVKGLSISIGHASSQEFPSENISEIMQISDERMYAAKEEYYKKSGKNRRKK